MRVNLGPAGERREACRCDAPAANTESIVIVLPSGAGRYFGRRVPRQSKLLTQKYWNSFHRRLAPCPPGRRRHIPPKLHIIAGQPWNQKSPGAGSFIGARTANFGPGLLRLLPFPPPQSRGPAFSARDVFRARLPTGPAPQEVDDRQQDQRAQQGEQQGRKAEVARVDGAAPEERR
jgi:hypothetical protein